MQKLILHIGLPKTGTSHIQHWLALNRARLAQAGYWVSDQSIHAHRIAAEYIADPKRAARVDVQRIRETPMGSATADLAAALADPAVDTGIMSSEYFFECDPRLVAGLRALTQDCRIVILAFLRRQDRLLESGYNQEVKAMGTTRLIGAPGYSDKLNWLKLYESWTGVFGQDNTVFVNYDAIANTKSLLPAFCKVIGLPQAFVDDSDQGREDGGNESLSANALEFKRLANVFGEFGLEELLARAARAGLPGIPFRLPVDVAARYLAHFDESNRELARRLEHSQSADLFSTQDLEATAAGTDFFNQMPIETLAQLLAFYIRENDARYAKLAARLDRLESQRAG